MLTDLHWALRTITRERGLAALIVITLALGVGSTAAVFGMVDQILLRPLPGVGDWQGAAYLQFRTADQPSGTRGYGIATLDFDELRRNATLLEGMASYGNVDVKAAVDDTRPIRVGGNTIYGDFFGFLTCLRPRRGKGKRGWV